MKQQFGESPDYRAEAAGLEDALGWFRGSMHAWSEAVTPDWKLEPEARRSSAPARWVLMAATLVILAVVPIYRNAVRQRAVEQARADALLLEQVDAGLSRPVPAPMEPLLSLVPGDIR